ncbi:MAG: ATP-dependent DNA helicase [Planctomycetaceae bacterium]|nr:ATP-dependent DNA helicase [Planctomycetaceae bacterium]
MSDTALDGILSKLNTQQREAATHGTDPLLIVAGAGTGKTTTLAHRVAWQIATGTDPGKILLLTFTRRASAEMVRRVDGILRELAARQQAEGLKSSHLTGRKVWGGTFHSMGTRFLRQHGKLINLKPEFTILDRSDSEDLMNVIRNDLELAKTDKRFPLKGTCMAIYSRCINSQQRPETILKRHYPWCVEQEDGLKQLFKAYTERKEQQGCFDYDDLLVFWNALLAEPACRELIQHRFDAVLVDEYQDTNLIQASILRHLCPEGKGLTVVGDDAQSIYSFRAATVRNILDFPEQFAGTRVVKLEENYRSTQPILEATNRVIAHASEHHDKQLFSQREAGALPAIVSCQDEDEQTEFVIEEILTHRETGIPLTQHAVLFRASHHSMALEVELSRRDIPFHKYGGLKFIETAHVKDLIAFLRVVENPLDQVSANRILMLLPGVGPRKARQLAEMLAAAEGNFDAWNDYKPPKAAADYWPACLRLMKQLAGRSKSDNDVAAEVYSVRKFYSPLLEQKYDHAQARLRDIEQLEQVAVRFPDRTTFLTEITLDPPSSTQELAADPYLDEDYLILSTIHSSKGLEWDSVFVIHAADGNIPSDMATKNEAEIEEERRLLYVAMTRAKNRLFVCHPQRYYFHSRHRSDSHSFSQLTRFLPKDVQQVCERRAAGIADSFDSVDQATDVTTGDIRRSINDMWS